MGELERAVEYLESAKRIWQDTGHRFEEGVIFGEIGKINWKNGNLQDAVKSFEEAIAIAKEVGDVVGEGVVNYNLAAMFSEQSKNQEALIYAERALRAYQKSGYSEYAHDAEQLIIKLRECIN
jgi:tetratricopeptide (TPR) repeat protein